MIAVAACLQAGIGGLGKRDAMYVGGTATFPEQTHGKLSASDEKVFTFDYDGGKLAVPYERVNQLEYGQSAGRRLGLAIAVSPAALLSKKRKHFLTISYVDDQEKQQALVFELGKDIVRPTLASLQARCGRKIEFQDEEAWMVKKLHFGLPACTIEFRASRPKSGELRTGEFNLAELSAKLLNAKRIYVETFGEDEINRTLEAMVVDSSRASKQFMITENKEKADLILKGSAFEKTSEEAHALGSSTLVSGAAGSHQASVSGTRNSISGSSSGGFISRALGINDSQSSVKTVDDARLAVRLVSPDGDVVWSATEESKGAKYKGASADVADLVVKALIRELERLKSTTAR